MRILSAILILVPAVVGGCSIAPGMQPAPREAYLPPAASEGPVPLGAVRSAKLEPFSLGTIGRLHTCEGVFLASQPSADDLREASRRGLRTLVNLRPEREISGFDERRVATEAGLDYVNVPWSRTAELTDEAFDRTRALFRAARRPLLIHCGVGSRVGAVWIPWRVLDGGVPLESAVAEARKIGPVNLEFELAARDYVARQQFAGSR